MKTSMWIRRMSYVVSLSVFAGVLATCNLQKTQEPFYRVMAKGYGTSIAARAGLYQDPSVYISMWELSGGDSAGGWWQKEISEDELEKCRNENSSFHWIGLGVEARYQTDYDNLGAGRGYEGPLATRIVHVDDKGHETTLADDSTPCSNACVSYAYLWPPPPPGGGPPIKVICAELHRQGLMDETIFEADEAFGEYLRDNQRDVLRGYRLWAKPVAGWMQKSETATRIVAFIAKPWSYEMAYRMGARDKGSLAGKILMDVGVPICRAIGIVAKWAGNGGSHDFEMLTNARMRSQFRQSQHDTAHFSNHQ